MLLYVLNQGYVGVFPTDDPDETLNNLNKFSPLKTHKLAVTEEEEREVHQLCKKFKEPFYHGHWFFAVPSLMKHILTLPRATSTDELRKFRDHLNEQIRKPEDCAKTAQ